jgi:hypothetical protein
MERHIKHIKQSCNVGGRKVIEIYAVAFVVIVSILIILLLFILFGKSL